MASANLAVKVQARVGWAVFVLKVANWLLHHRLTWLALAWIWLLHPTIVILVHVQGCYRRLRVGPFRFRVRRWEPVRVPALDTLRQRRT